MANTLSSVIAVPVRQTDIRAIMALRQKSVQIAAEIARKVVGAADIVVRDLSPSDVNGSAIGRLNNPNALTANTAVTNQFSSFALTSTQACVIYGYAALSALPLIDQITFGLAGAGTFAQLQLDSIYSEQVPTMLWEPIPYQPNEKPTIGLLAGALGGSGTTVAANAEQFLILGVIADQAGLAVATPRIVSDIQRADAARAAGWQAA